MIEQSELNKSTAVVTVAPDESIDTIIKNIKNAKAERITLLVPDGSAALQSRKSCLKMREVLDPEGVDVVLFTTDEAVIRAAEKCQMVVIEIDPSALHPMASSPPPRANVPPVVPPMQPRSAEEDFLASLESMPPATGDTRVVRDVDIFAQPATPQSKIDEWSVGLDRSPAPTPSKVRPIEEDSWDFSGFDDLSDAISGNTASPALTAAERPRIRPEDIELSSEDMTRQDPKLRRAKSDAIRYEEKQAAKAEAKAQRARPAVPTWLLAVIALGLIALLAWLFLFKNRNAATIIVRPPANPIGAKVYNNVRLNYQDETVSDQSSAAVQGRVIEVPVSVTVKGKVKEATIQPDKSASGVIQVINRNPQAYTLQANTQVKTTNANGEELLYNVAQDSVVPAATASIVNVSYGIADVPIVASAGGERYNLGADASNPRWTIVGYEGALIAVNPNAIEGGTNVLLKIPSIEKDVAPLLGQAIPQFQNQVLSAMQGQLQSGEAIAGIDFTPSIAQLAQNPSLYDIQTRPIPDTDGDFEAIITANFRTLAVKGDFNQQLQRALANGLRINDPNFNPDVTNIVSSSLQLGDPGTNLLLANIATAPKSKDPIPAATINQIRESLKGLTLAEAQNKLKALRDSGLIGDVIALPQLDKLPDDPSKITIKVQQ